MRSVFFLSASSRTESRCSRSLSPRKRKKVEGEGRRWRTEGKRMSSTLFPFGRQRLPSLPRQLELLMRISLVSLSRPSARVLATCSYASLVLETRSFSGPSLHTNRAHHLLPPPSFLLPALGLSPSTASPRRQVFSPHQQLTLLSKDKFVNQNEARRILLECKARRDGGADLLSREMFRAVNGRFPLLFRLFCSTRTLV